MDIAEYGIGEWDAEHWGNHRALILTRADPADPKAPGVKVSIPWRRCDNHPEKKGIFVRSARTGEEMQPVYIHSIGCEAGEIAFFPASGAGVYEVYYMRFEGTTRAPYPVITYMPHPETDSPEYRELRLNWPRLPAAELIRLESRNTLHSFYPMEVIAADREVDRLLDEHRHFLIFGESREHPIRMKNRIPHRWVHSGAFKDIVLEARKGEYLTFQLGIYAHKSDLKAITARYANLTALRGGGHIPGEAITCFNLGGIDCKGRPFEKNLNLPKGRVQPLWIGADISPALPPGTYSGPLIVEAEGNLREEIRVTVTVNNQTIPSRGDDVPENHSRLRWLNSTLGSEETPIAPFTPVHRESGDSEDLSILGRRLRIGRDALPESIMSFFTPELTGIGEESFPILAAPVRFLIYPKKTPRGQTPPGEKPKPEPWRHHESSTRITPGGSAVFSHSARTECFTLHTRGTLEPDGCMEYRCDLRPRESEESEELEDTVLEIPLHPGAVKYILGLGFTGGAAPESFEWRWDVENKNQDALWIGSERGGLQISLRDENYRRPLNTNFYRLQPLRSPPSWDNRGKGRITFEKRPGGPGIIRCSGGPRKVRRGETLHFHFRLLITPFRPIDTDKQWSTRFCHRGGEPGEIRKTGANVINLHHADPVNPYINYPFLRPEELKAYADETHRLGMKLRLYYTVRELTNHAPEIHALRSLGDEIFTKGPGGGHSWLQEHLREDYIAAWHVFEYGCAAVANSGESRWHNYYVEGLNYLAEKMEIDGIYIDDLAFDRETMKRVRRVLDRHRQGALIDLHSASQFNEKDGYANSINLYMEHLPYLDRIWFGEYFDYSRGPEYWITEVAGIPFGTMGEMLQDGGHLWRGMLYGITSRYPHEKSDPRPLWQLQDEFGIMGSDMYGYWSPRCPVHTSREDIPATVYRKPESLLIALASWSEEDEPNLRLSIDWDTLPFPPEEAVLKAPALGGHQKETSYTADQPVFVPGNAGVLLILQKRNAD